MKGGALIDHMPPSERRGVPMVVEVKCGEAADSLTGVVLELLVQWCFFRCAMQQLREQFFVKGMGIAPDVTQPDAVVAAPEAYFMETMRRSHDTRRRDEAVHALRFVHLVEESTGMRVRFVAISDDWPKQGTGFRCRELSPVVSHFGTWRT
jgi:hypothetical protein